MTSQAVCIKMNFGVKGDIKEDRAYQFTRGKSGSTYIGEKGDGRSMNSKTSLKMLILNVNVLCQMSR